MNTPVIKPAFAHRLTPHDAQVARNFAIQLASRRAENGDPVLSVWSQYEASVALIDEMAGGRA